MSVHKKNTKKEKTGVVKKEKKNKEKKNKKDGKGKKKDKKSVDGKKSKNNRPSIASTPKKVKNEVKKEDIKLKEPKKVKEKKKRKELKPSKTTSLEPPPTSSKIKKTKLEEKKLEEKEKEKKNKSNEKIEKKSDSKKPKEEKRKSDPKKKKEEEKKEKKSDSKKPREVEKKEKKEVKKDKSDPKPSAPVSAVTGSSTTESIIPVQKKSEPKMETPKTEPNPPWVPPNTDENEKRTKSLYKILDDVSDSKSSMEKVMSGSKKEGKPMTPEVKTPDVVGPPLDESLKLAKTQSSENQISPPKSNLGAPIAPGPPSKVCEQKEEKGIDLPMESPPKSDPCERPVAVPRSELDNPPIEPDFIRHNGNTVMVPPHQPIILTNNGIGKVDVDLVGRTGMYLERFGMPQDRKKAFDWIAYQRHDLNGKETMFSSCLAVALNDVGITKPLLIRTLAIFKSTGQITGVEHDRVLKEVQTAKAEKISFSQMSDILRRNCAIYKNTPPVVRGVPNVVQK